MGNVNLDLKFIGEIRGNFIVPAYQRGYRWSKEVKILLDDIDLLESGTNYCLQPIVVKRIDEKTYELIDGQQRLTSIFLIYKYIEQLKEADPLDFTIDYKIRNNSKSFLDKINKIQFSVDSNNDVIINIPTDDIDCYFFIEAYKIIISWFKKESKERTKASELDIKFNKFVKVIWYETDDKESGESLFTRLNIGRIPLTNAELVKALFFSKDVIDEKKQLEIATVWDIIEKELHNDSFWYFLTNDNKSEYPTRIELILNLIAKKNKNEKDEYFTFFHFNGMMKKKNKSEIWKEIVSYFYRLKEWYEDSNMYHKIGYIIATQTKELMELIDKSENLKKSDFKNTLDEYIANSIKPKKSWHKLDYRNDSDYDFINSLLLLFNIETLRQKNDETIRFPFIKHKDGSLWTLEHIHAQNSKGMDTEIHWREWLKLHRESLENLDRELHKNLIDEIKMAEDLKKLSREIFTNLFDKIIPILSKEKDTEYINRLSNLALLGQKENSTLSNWTFDVKRIKFLEMDKKGEYIPICTRHVFLKYYTSLKSTQVQFWSEDDRTDYLSEMNKTLKSYLNLINEEIKI